MGCRSLSLAGFALVCSLMAFAASATFFEMDEARLGGVIRTVLPDGRIRVRSPHAIKSPLVLPEDSAPRGTDEAYITSKIDAVMKPHWHFMDVEKHSASLICHDQGEVNLRLSVFKPSAELVAALRDTSKTVVLTASANRIQCHGTPLFRRVDRAVFPDATSSDAVVVLVTSVARYQDIFDEADVLIEVKHPLITHLTSHDNAAAASRWSRRAPDFGRRGAGNEQVDRAVAPPSNESATYATRSVTAFRSAPYLEAIGGGNDVQTRRRAMHTLSWFGSITSFVSSAASSLVAAVGTQLASAVNAIAKVVAIDVNFERTLAATSYSRKQSVVIKTIDVNFNVDFNAAVLFQMKIGSNKLTLMVASLKGDMALSGGATFTVTRKIADSSQSTLFTITGPKFSFLVGPVPVWVTSNMPVIAAYEYSFDFAASFWSTYSATGNMELGVRYTNQNGFTVIGTKDFSKDANYGRSSSIVAVASASIQAMAQFTVQSMATGYATLAIGLSNTMSSNSRDCGWKCTSNYFAVMTAGLNIDISVASFNIFTKSYGPLTLYSDTKTFWNFCTAKSNSHRNFQALQLSPSSTVLDASDNGKTWTSSLSNCSAGRTAYTLSATGYFFPNSTVLVITLSQNTSLLGGTGGAGRTGGLASDDGMYALASQSAIFVIASGLSKGLRARALVCTESSALSLGMSVETYRALSTFSTGSSNVTAVPLHYIDVEVSDTTFDSVSFSNADLCGGETVAAPTKAASASSPPITALLQQLLDALLNRVLAGKFIDVVTDGLSAIGVLVVVELLCTFAAPQILGKRFPVAPSPPRTREKALSVAALCAIVLSFILFVAAGSLPFAVVAGARVDRNASTAVDSRQATPLVASGVEIELWRFQGVNVDRLLCPQYYPCSPNCRDLCATTTFSWSDAPWPSCSSLDPSDCITWAKDAIAEAFFALTFAVVGIVPPLFFFSTVFRRLPVVHVCLMVITLCIYLLKRRIVSFLEEVVSQRFAPAPNMIVPFQLSMATNSESLWQASAVFVFLTTAAFGLFTLVEVIAAVRATGSGAAGNGRSTQKFDPTCDDKSQELISADEEERNPAATRGAPPTMSPPDHQPSVTTPQLVEQYNKLL